MRGRWEEEVEEEEGEEEMLPSCGLGRCLTPTTGGETECVTGHPRSRRRLNTRGRACSRMAAIFDFLPLFGFRDVIYAKEGPLLLMKFPIIRIFSKSTLFNGRIKLKYTVGNYLLFLCMFEK